MLIVNPEFIDNEFSEIIYQKPKKIKRTIRRKYTLGKSKIYKRVSILHQPKRKINNICI